MTPHELALAVEVFNEKQKAENEERLILVYAGAAWQRAKKMPSLKEILRKEPAKKKMTNEEMLNEVKKLNAALGGITY
ncbi:hypothetical protein [Neobacillus mesonae]|uniref:hypothetical protein n=1 Tax=Neobacillus mesonae TaxID=1193713 RepID=UPI002E1A6E79|nr:hypothetical protein [Neobacillus mesonae]